MTIITCEQHTVREPSRPLWHLQRTNEKFRCYSTCPAWTRNTSLTPVWCTSCYQAEDVITQFVVLVSMKLYPSQNRLSTFGRELLETVVAFHHFLNANHVHCPQITVSLSHYLYLRNVFLSLYSLTYVGLPIHPCDSVLSWPSVVADALL